MNVLNLCILQVVVHELQRFCILETSVSLTTHLPQKQHTVLHFFSLIFMYLHL